MKMLLIVITVIMMLLPSILLASSKTVICEFDEKGFLVLEGRKQFPLGIFVSFLPGWVDSDPNLIEESLADIQKSPFNFMINYGSRSGTLEQKKRYYELVSKHELWEFYSLEKYFKEIGHDGWQIQFEGTEQEVITKEINNLKELPGILGWYIWDELPQDGYLIREHHLWAKAADSTRPTLLLASQQTVQDLRQYANSGDIYAIDRYPLPVRGEITLVADVMDNLTAATPPNKPLWFTVQGFGDYVYGDVRKGEKKVSSSGLRGRMRAPTPAEMQCMTYLSLVHGAKGVIFYYYKDFQLSFDKDTRWPAIKAIASDVRNLETILMADNYPSKIQTNNMNVHWMAKYLNGKIYIIAVNATREVQDIIFQFSRQVHITKVMQGHSFNYARDNQIALIMDGYNIIVLELGESSIDKKE